MGLGFTINRIITEQFAVFPEHLDLNQEEVQVSYTFNFSLDSSKQQVEVFTSFDFKQNQLPVMKVVVSCSFGIWDDAWNSFIKENSVYLPRDFATNLFSISVGTTRGILSSKTEHTDFSKFIIPLLDVQHIITSDVILE